MIRNYKASVSFLFVAYMYIYTIQLLLQYAFIRHWSGWHLTTYYHIFFIISTVL